MWDNLRPIPRGKNLENMELEELIENTLRRKHLEDMIAWLDEIGKDLKEVKNRLSDMD